MMATMGKGKHMTKNINKRAVITATRNELDLTNQSDVNNFINCLNDCCGWS